MTRSSSEAARVHHTARRHGGCKVGLGADADTMSKIDWDERVEVRLLETSVVEGSVQKWDGISLSEAVERCLGLPPDEQPRASIVAPSGWYRWDEIEVLFQRSDFPHSIGLN
jgi:hypothetical protein